MKIKDLIIGAIYTEGKSKFIFEYNDRPDNTIGYQRYICIVNNIYYSDNSKSHNGRSLINTKLATPEETHWLKQCIKGNNFISKEKALKTFNNKVDLDYEIY